MGWKVTANFFHPNSCSWIGHDEQNQRLSSFLMIDDAGDAFINPWNRCDSCFHFRKTHSHSSHFQKCPFASFDPQITFFILASQVAGSQPAIAEDTTRFFWLVQITGAYGWSLDQQLADLPCVQSISFVIDDPNHQVVQRPAYASTASPPSVLVPYTRSERLLRFVRT